MASSSIHETKGFEIQTRDICSPPKRASFVTLPIIMINTGFSALFSVYRWIVLTILLCFNFQSVIEQYNYKGMLNLQVKARQH